VATAKTAYTAIDVITARSIAAAMEDITQPTLIRPPVSIGNSSTEPKKYYILIPLVMP
jgi:hypothetical protein